MPFYVYLNDNFLYSGDSKLEGSSGDRINYARLARVEGKICSNREDTTAAFHAMIEQVRALGGDAATDVSVKASRGRLSTWTTVVSAMAVKTKS